MTEIIKVASIQFYRFYCQQSMSTPDLFPSTLALAALLSKIFVFPTKKDCLSFLEAKRGKYKISQKQRQDLCELAGVEEQWVKCDQNIDGNLRDISSRICSELYEPYHFYCHSIRRADNTLINHQDATVPLHWEKKSKFWVAWNKTKTFEWLPSRACTYDAVVHFIQEGSGTGVHIGDGIILTCAHVSHSCSIYSLYQYYFSHSCLSLWCFFIIRLLILKMMTMNPYLIVLVD
jgi:hypothetical protein